MTTHVSCGRVVILVGALLALPAAANAQQSSAGGSSGGVGTMNSGSGSTSSGFSTGSGTTGGSAVGANAGPASGTQVSSTLNLNTTMAPTVAQSYAIGGKAALATTTRPANVATSNPFANWYANPLAAGKPGASVSAGGFGTPLFGNITQGGSTNNLGSGIGGTAGIGGAATGGRGFNTAASSRVPAYTASMIGFTQPAPAPAAMQVDLRQVIAGADALTMRDNLQLTVEGNAVVLRGDVADARERRLAENLLRLKPGVRSVRNELQVREILPAPKPVNPAE